MNRLVVLAACAVVTMVMAMLLFSNGKLVFGAEKKAPSVAPDSNADREDGVPLDVARDRAKVMHDVYEATLEVLHHRYFHGNRATVPARAMQDIFSTIERQSKVKARWISVNMKPMSIDHEPETKFEKSAAKAIAKGKSHVDIVENGYYRRAGAIPLSAGCVGCHGGLSSNPSTTPKFAALVISIPVRQDKPEAPAR
jgi:hypothetical protein